MTSPALWLAVRELGARRARVALAAAVVAATVAAATAIELVARAREQAIAAEVDQMGPAITIAPAGVTAGALARGELGEGLLPRAVEARARAALGGDLRAVQRRLVLHRDLSGVRAPIVGVGEEALPVAARTSGGVVLGSELVRRLGAVSSVSLSGRTHRVSATMPSTGSVDDTAVFLPLSELQALASIAGANELRLFLRAGVSPRDAEVRLARAQLGAAVIRSDRGEVADGQAQESLARHRMAAYAVMAVVAALCLLIAAHLDAAERRVELATVIALGGSRWTVLGALLSRSTLVAGAGAGVGVFGGAALAIAQEPGVLAVAVVARGVAGATVAAAVALGLLASAPTAFAAAARDPVRDLQEG